MGAKNITILTFRYVERDISLKVLNYSLHLFEPKYNTVHCAITRIIIGSSQNNAWFQPLVVMAATFVILKTSDSDIVENAYD